MALSWSPLSPARGLSWTALLCVVAIVLALGGYARLYDLGGAPLAEDEYYTTKSIESVVDDGVPEIPGGGYYDRGLLFQYAAAGFAELFGADAFAYRLPAALCGLLVGVLGFFYARRFGGVALGLAVAAALLLSSWTIEFSRLVRFYTLFQVTLLLFLIALDKAYFEARAGWRYVPHAALLLAACAHELSLLFTPLLFLPLLPAATNLRLQAPRRWLGFVLVSLVTTIVVLALTIGLPLGADGVTDYLPEDYDRSGGGILSRFATPALPYFRLFSEPILHLATIWLMAAGMVMAFVVARRLGARRIELPDLVLALALLAAVFHLFAAVGLVLLFAFARYDLWRLAAQPARRLVLLGATLAIVAGWLALAAAAPERLITHDEIVARWNLDASNPSMLGATLRAVWSTFFGWPDFYRMTLRPFGTELPEIGLAVVAALIWFVIAHRHAPWPKLLRHPGALVLYWAITTGFFVYPSTNSRYWFPLLPVLYTLLAVSLAEIVSRWRPHAEPVARGAASAAFLLLFALSPDFQPYHILNTGDDSVDYRTGAFARFDETWYPRRDVRAAAATVMAEHAASPGARIVVDTLPALSYYLDLEHAVYLDRCCARFAGHSRERGTREKWSGQRLLGTSEEVLAYARGGEELWVVRETDPERRDTDLAALTNGPLTEVSRERLGQDDRIELIRLRPDAGERRQTRSAGAATDSSD